MNKLVATTLFLLGCACFAQTADPKMTFEVASVKPSDSKSVRMFVGGPGSGDSPGRIFFTRATLQDLLFRAYGLLQVDQISGPGWLGEERYDLVAKMPLEVGKEQFQFMLRNLLVDRFKLTVRLETKTFPVYELVLVKSGHKLKKSVATDGPPVMRMSFDADARAHLIARQQSPSTLAAFLRQPAGRLVFDKTGLTDKYDFDLEFNSRPELTNDSPLPDVFAAIQQQAGLRLDDARAPLDLVVVEHAEKVPTEN